VPKRAALTILPFVLVSLAGPTARAPFGGATARAAADTEDELVVRGVALRRDGDDQAAADIFRQAYERFHTPRAAGQLGLAEQALGRWEDAEAHLREALRAENDPWVKKNHATLGRDMITIKTHIARVEILGQPEGAEIIVNGRAAGRLPLPGPVSTSAGEVDVEGRAPGYQREVRRLSLIGGQYQHIVIRLQKEAVPGPAAVAVSPAALVTPPPAVEPPTVTPSVVAPPPTEGQAASNPRRLAKWTALGLSGVGLGVGITSTIIRSSKLDQFKKGNGGTCVEMAGRGVDGDGTPIPECQSLLDSYNGTQKWQIIGFVSAGVFAATWLVLMLTEPPASASPASVAHARSWMCAPSAEMQGASCLFSM
jgi:hypothetical protein